MEKLGKRIAHLRKERGITQSELAKMCYKDRQSLHRVENGLRLPSTFYIYELSTALNVSPGEFLKFYNFPI
jgi:transcriptional regulator with XRE-family HTH domain